MTRRRALQLGLATACALVLERIGVGQAALAERTGPAGSTSSENLFELWQKRGWVREARHYTKLGRNVRCNLCPNTCSIAPGGRSRCRTKLNRDGTLYTLAYGNPCAFHVDPVEKKPLYHFLPGSRTFSIATAGCVFRCLNCQNWEISQRTPEETKDPTGEEVRLKPPLPERLTYEQVRRASMFPEDVVAIAKAMDCPSISYTYSEPIAYYEYAQDTARLAREHGLRNIMVTCASINEQPLRDLYRYVDAAHVDLKGFDDGIYRRLNAGRLEPVLRAIKTIREMGVWFEIVNLIVPTYTDNMETIRKMCGWILRELGPDIPLHFSRFHPNHKLTHLYPTPLDTLLEARDVALREGLHFVYIGNVPELPDAGTTTCPGCKKQIIQRTVYAVTRLDLADGKCKGCGRKIPGVWA